LHSIIIKIRLNKTQQELSAFFQDIREKNEAFGSSLLLANSPMSPKVVNGSFAAIVDADEFLAKAYAGIRIAVSCLRPACSGWKLSASLRVGQAVRLEFSALLTIIFNQCRITIRPLCDDVFAGF
jgi:hypothetical protein